ncbi:MAG: dinucleotide-utilizing enzyme [Actinobacteria bacterium]|nr:dinucleotide-utilizing enzyme [Actinomycetota bacterium]
MTRALNRSIPFWILLAASVGLVAAGAVTVLDHLGTMTTTLKNGSATGLEVYAGQSWIVIGAALLGAGALGILLTLSLTVVSALLGAATAKSVEIGPLVFDDVDAAAQGGEESEFLHGGTVAAQEVVLDGSTQIEVEPQDDDEAADGTQNGSSGSTATARKISVK